MSLRRSGETARPSPSRLIAVAATIFGLASAGDCWAWQDKPAVGGNLSTKYLLVERFSTKEGKPGFVGQYQVAFREVLSSTDGRGLERTIQFSERPAAIGGDERRPTDVIRHYDSMRYKLLNNVKEKDKPTTALLDGLTLWCREMPGGPPRVISLTPNRILQQKEYEFAITNDYVSKLTSVLSDQPVRLGDTWDVSSRGVDALTNLGGGGEGGITATLTSVQNHPTLEGQQQAVIDLNGQLSQVLGNTPDGKVSDETAFRARMFFAFKPVPPLVGGDESTIDSNGAIEKLSLTQLTTKMPMKTWIRRELTLERRFPGQDPLLVIPEPPPVETPENSWLTISDSKNRFSIRHPQWFHQPMQLRPGMNPNALYLETESADDQPDFLSFELLDRGNIKPDDVFQKLKDSWKAGNVKTIPGLTHRLPDVEWPNMAVHHMAAALVADATPDQPASRRYFDGFVIQFPRNETMLITATTFSEKQAEFRKQVDTMLKTIKLGPL